MSPGFQALRRLSRFLDDSKAWLSSSQLRLNQASQDASLVAGLQVSTVQARCSRRSSPVNVDQNRRMENGE